MFFQIVTIHSSFIQGEIKYLSTLSLEFPLNYLGVLIAGCVVSL